MLHLEATALANEAQEHGLHILEKEVRIADITAPEMPLQRLAERTCVTHDSPQMNAVLLYLSNVGTQAALISGFVFVCFTEEVVLVDDDVHPAISLLGMGTAISCFAAMIYVIVCSTVSSSLGPILALKGKDISAMRRAGTLDLIQFPCFPCHCPMTTPATRILPARSHAYNLQHLARPGSGAHER